MPEAKLQGATIEVWNKSDLLHPGTLAAMQPARRPSQPRGPTVQTARPPPALRGGEADAPPPGRPGEESEGVGVGGGGGYAAVGSAAVQRIEVETCDPREAVGGGEGAGAVGEGMSLQETTVAIQRNTAWEIIKVIRTSRLP